MRRLALLTLFSFVSINVSAQPAKLVDCASNGDSLCQSELGLMYESGQGVPQDYVEAVKWFRKAAEQGHLQAQFNLGLMYFLGEGVEQNYSESAHWLRNAAMWGETNAQLQLAHMYATGEGLPQGNSMAYVWSSIALDSGEVNAAQIRDEAESRLSVIQLEAARIRWAEVSQEIRRNLEGPVGIDPRSVEDPTGMKGEKEPETNPVFENIVPIVAALVFALPIVLIVLWLYRFIRRSLSAGIEHYDRRAQSEMESNQAEKSTGTLIPFHIALYTNATLTAASLLVYYLVPFDYIGHMNQLLEGNPFTLHKLRIEATWPFYLLTLVFYFLTFREHNRAGNNRRKKYDFALAGIVTLWVSVVFFEALMGVNPWPIFIQPLICILLLWATSAVLRKFVPDNKNPGPNARKFHFYIKRLTPFVVLVFLFIFFTPLVLLIFLVVRYRVVQWMECCPIIYLRSFSQSSAPVVFRNIISKTCNRYGVLLALVHKRQRASKLRGDSAMYEGSQLTEVTGERWKSWVDEQLKIASVVIIDDTEKTEGVEWEVTRVKQICDPSRIAILRKGGSIGEHYPDFWHLDYDESRRGFRQARRRLKDWLAPIIFQDQPE